MRQLMCDICGDSITNETFIYYDKCGVAKAGMDVIFDTNIRIIGGNADICFNCQFNMLKEFFQKVNT